MKWRPFSFESYLRTSLKRRTKTNKLARNTTSKKAPRSPPSKAKKTPAKLRKTTSKVHRAQIQHILKAGTLGWSFTVKFQFSTVEFGGKKSIRNRRHVYSYPIL